MNVQTNIMKTYFDLLNTDILDKNCRYMDYTDIIYLHVGIEHDINHKTMSKRMWHCSTCKSNIGLIKTFKCDYCFRVQCEKCIIKVSDKVKNAGLRKSLPLCLRCDNDDNLYLSVYSNGYHSYGCDWIIKKR
jgi:hypothetical protein